jgi:DNA polymerase Ligase (LigD)
MRKPRFIPRGLGRGTGNGGSLNAPMLAWKTLYGKNPPYITGRSDSHAKKIIQGVELDANIPVAAFKGINAIAGLHTRSSCEGSGKDRPTFVIFRMDNQDANFVKTIVAKLNKDKAIKAGYDLGRQKRYRICVTTLLWYDKDPKRFLWWWNRLPQVIRGATYKAQQERIAAKRPDSSHICDLLTEQFGGKCLLRGRKIYFKPKKKVSKSDVFEIVRSVGEPAAIQKSFGYIVITASEREALVDIATDPGLWDKQDDAEEGDEELTTEQRVRRWYLKQVRTAPEQVKKTSTGQYVINQSKIEIDGQFLSFTKEYSPGWWLASSVILSSKQNNDGYILTLDQNLKTVRPSKTEVDYSLTQAARVQVFTSLDALKQWLIDPKDKSTADRKIINRIRSQNTSLYWANVGVSSFEQQNIDKDSFWVIGLTGKAEFLKWGKLKVPPIYMGPDPNKEYSFDYYAHGKQGEYILVLKPPRGEAQKQPWRWQISTGLPKGVGKKTSVLPSNGTSHTDVLYDEGKYRILDYKRGKRITVLLKGRYTWGTFIFNRQYGSQWKVRQVQSGHLGPEDLPVRMAVFAPYQLPQAGKRYKFVIHKHYRPKNRSTHWDLRINIPGRKMLSWALPKAHMPHGAEKILAVETTLHPQWFLNYESDEVPIKGGEVTKLSIVDSGWYKVIKAEPDKFVIELHGSSVHGRYALFRMKGVHWLIKEAKDWQLEKAACLEIN